MAGTKAHRGPEQVERWRNSIKVGKAIEILNKIVSGEYKGEVTMVRIKAIEILLRKTLPDTKSVEITGAGGEPIQFTWKPEDTDN